MKCFSNFTSFFQPQKFEYNVQEGKTVTVRYNVTVPIGCIGSSPVISSKCLQNFFLSLPEYQNRNQCTASTSYLNFNQYYCGFAINFDSWKQPVELVVHGRTSGLYDHTDRTMFIHIKSATSTTSSIWDNASIPEVKVSYFSFTSTYFINWTKDILLSCNQPNYKDNGFFSEYGLYKI